MFSKGFFLGIVKVRIVWQAVNSLPYDKIFRLIQIQSIADDKLDLIQEMKSHFHTVVNIVGKGENAGYQHFVLFPQCFLKAFFVKVVKNWNGMVAFFVSVVKSGDCVVKG